MEQINLLILKIRAAESILIFGHKNPDGDSAGACLGLAELLRDNMDKNPVVIYDGNLPMGLDFLPGRDSMIYADKLDAQKFDLAIAVDVAQYHQIGDAQKIFWDIAADTVRIDHHKSGAEFASLNIVRDDFVAAAEIIFEIAKIANWKISVPVANNLYVGLWSDTGSFNYLDRGDVFRAAAELIDLGADARTVQPNMNTVSRKDIMAETTAMSATEFFYDGKLAIVPVAHDQYKKLDSGETPLIMRMRSVRGVEIVVILKESHPDKIHASMRSEKIPVRPVAEKLGGGGHDMAAAAVLAMSLQDAKKLIVKEFSGIIK